MNAATLIILTLAQQPTQPQFRRGTTQQQWNAEVEVGMKQLGDNMQTLTDTLKTRNDEMVEVGKLIQNELETNSSDVEKLRQQVNAMTARMTAKDDAGPKQEPLPAGAALIGFGLLFATVGILAVNCVRLLFDVRMQKLVLGLIEVRQPLGSLEASENARHIPDPAYK